MPEPQVADLKQVFDTSGIAESRQLSCLNGALRTVKRRLGVEAYGEIFLGDTSTVEDSEYLDENTTTADEEELRLGSCTDAVYYYAAACLVLNTQLRIRPAGIVKKEQDPGSPAMSQSFQTTNEYISVAEAKEYADWLTSIADGYIAPYVIEQEPINPYGIGKLVRA